MKILHFFGNISIALARRLWTLVLCSKLVLSLWHAKNYLEGECLDYMEQTPSKFVLRSYNQTN